MGNKSSKTPANKSPKNEEVEINWSQPQDRVLSGRVSPPMNIPGSQEDKYIRMPDKINSNDQERCKNCTMQYLGNKYKPFCSGECKKSFEEREKARKLAWEAERRKMDEERSREKAAQEELAAISALLHSSDDDDDEEPSTKSQGFRKNRNPKLRRKNTKKSSLKKTLTLEI